MQNAIATIRKAVVEDAAAIARIHIDTWRSTYHSLVPQDYLGSLDYEKRTKSWEQYLSEKSEARYFVAVLGETIIGFVATGPNRDAKLKHNFAGEVYAIYLLKEHQGKGIGKKLFEAAVSQLVLDGMSSMIIWVLDGNPTIGFYERMGGVRIGDKPDEIGGKLLKEICVGWATLKSTPL